MITNETLRVKESLNGNINIMNWMIADVFKIMQKQVWKNYKRDNLSISLSKFDKHNSDFISVKDWAYFISKSWLVIEREIIGCTQSAQVLCISFYWGEDTQKKWVNILDPMIRFNPFEKNLGMRNCLRSDPNCTCERDLRLRAYCINELQGCLVDTLYICMKMRNIDCQLVEKLMAINRSCK